MSTKFDIEVTLVELINNNFLLFKNDIKKKNLWITRPENVLRVLVLSPRLGALATIPLTLIFWTVIQITIKFNSKMRKLSKMNFMTVTLTPIQKMIHNMKFIQTKVYL
jgi:hypothetical protein